VLINAQREISTDTPVRQECLKYDIMGTIFGHIPIPYVSSLFALAIDRK
jgi:hypothetical protein